MAVKGMMQWQRWLLVLGVVAPILGVCGVGLGFYNQQRDNTSAIELNYDADGQHADEPMHEGTVGQLKAVNDKLHTIETAQAVAAVRQELQDEKLDLILQRLVR